MRFSGEGARSGDWDGATLERCGPKFYEMHVWYIALHVYGRFFPLFESSVWLFFRKRVVY